MKNIAYSESGFSLIELLVAITIFSLILVGILALVTGVLGNSNKQSTLVDTNDQARKATFNLTQELRNAVSSSAGSYAVDTTSAQQFIFYTNTGTSIDRIRYYIQNGSLYKGVTKYSAGTYNVATEVSTLILKNLANGANPIFYYYDGNYDGVTDTALTQPVNPTLVRFVKMSLKVYKTGGVANTNTFTITAGGAIRSLKTNL